MSTQHFHCLVEERCYVSQLWWWSLKPQPYSDIKKSSVMSCEVTQVTACWPTFMSFLICDFSSLRSAVLNGICTFCTKTLCGAPTEWTLGFAVETRFIYNEVCIYNTMLETEPGVGGRYQILLYSCVGYLADYLAFRVTVNSFPSWLFTYWNSEKCLPYANLTPMALMMDTCTAFQ